MNYYTSALIRLKTVDLQSNEIGAIEGWPKEKSKWYSDLEKRATTGQFQMPKIQSEERLKTEIEFALGLLERADAELGKNLVLEIVTKSPTKTK